MNSKIEYKPKESPTRELPSLMSIKDQMQQLQDSSMIYMKMKNNRILLKTFTVDDQLGS